MMPNYADKLFEDDPFAAFCNIVTSIAARLLAFIRVPSDGLLIRRNVDQPPRNISARNSNSKRIGVPVINNLHVAVTESPG
jgi:hypothetical protein